MPGYGGFVPYLISDNKYGKTYGKITRQCFSNPKLGKNPFKLSTTGFNAKRYNFVDETKAATTHKYGKQTIIPNHPCLDVPLEKRITEFKDSFKDVRLQVPPTYRKTDKNLQTKKECTTLSGFKSNHSEFDSKGWKPHPVLNGKSPSLITTGRMDRTEYREKINKLKPFHRDTHIYSLRKLRKSLN